MMKGREGLEKRKIAARTVAAALLAVKNVVRREIDEWTKEEEPSPVAGYFGLQSDVRL